MRNPIVQQVSQRTGEASWKVDNTIGLLADGATVPFIARYRKEAIGSLDEVAISSINKEYKKLLDLQSRKDTILETIKGLHKLTDDLHARIDNCWVATELEDIYLPFKPKRQTRATKARSAGLEPMAKILMKQHESNPEHRARQFTCSAYPEFEAVIIGAQDIIAEWVAESAQARTTVRQIFDRQARIFSKLIKGKEAEGQKYRDYFEFDEPLKKCPSHRLLAMRRGEKEGVLRVSIHPDKARTIERLQRMFVKSNNRCGQLVGEAVQDAYRRLLSSSIETEFKNASKERADQEAIAVFAQNLKQLLLAPPLGRKIVLAIDPGFRSGCKVVCLDGYGKFISNSTIFPNPPQGRTQDAANVVTEMIRRYSVEVVAIGSGTAGRETEAWIKTLLPEGVDVYLISEDGASVYSASNAAREEFPELDLTVRGAISIGRRLQDPLAELVKIDPKSIGVGQYQHDVDQKLLRESLGDVIVSCVNSIGVNLNTASLQLLHYVSGISPTTAQNILDYRKKHNAFTTREMLKRVKGIGPKAYEQSAGFLRIPEGDNPLDNSAVHPERYNIVNKMAGDLGLKIEALVGNSTAIDKLEVTAYVTDDIGLPTLNDITSELKKPGLDPRGRASVFSFADNVHSIEDIIEGMVIPGKVTNVTKFGAFVDIGIKENGLIHVSQMADRFVSDPAQVVAVGQQLDVKVIEVDRSRGRISLSLRK